jgi:hypothetical protein
MPGLRFAASVFEAAEGARSWQAAGWTVRILGRP